MNEMKSMNGKNFLVAMTAFFYLRRAGKTTRVQILAALSVRAHLIAKLLITLCWAASRWPRLEQTVSHSSKTVSSAMR